MHENNDSRRMHNLRNFSVADFAPIAWTLTLASLTVFACVLVFIPFKTVRYIALTLLFFVWGILAAKQILWAGETLTGATQDAIVEITATDGMTTHYGQITHLQGRRIFPAPGLVLYGEYLPQAVCAGQLWSMKLKVRAVHGQLNDGGFDSQRYAIASISRSPAAFCRQVSLNRIVACVHSIWRHYKQRCNPICGTRLFLV